MLNFDYRRAQVAVSIIFDASTRLKAPIRDIFRWKGYSFGMSVHILKKSLAIIKTINTYNFVVCKAKRQLINKNNRLGKLKNRLTKYYTFIE